MNDSAARHNPDEQDLRGMPRDLSWYYLTPLEYTRRLAAELRKQREAHEAKVGPLPTYTEGQEFSTTEILRHVAVNKRDPDFSIPAAVTDAITRAWYRLATKIKQPNDDRRAERDRRREKARAAADKLRAENPGISDSAIARTLADATTTERTIRDYIKKD